MPRIVYELPELEASVTRPVLMDVIRTLFSKMGIDEKDTFIQFPGNSSQVAQSGSTLQDTTDEARLAFDNRFIVSVDEDYPEETGMTMVVHRPENVVFFADRALDIYMKPMYNLTTYTINIKFRARSKTEADRWKERVFRQIGKTRIGFDHVCTYHYPVPTGFIGILETMHKLREGLSPYNESMKDWIKRCMSTNFTVITNQGGKASVMAIRETSIGSVGQLDFGGNPPKPEREEGSGVWEASFEYIFNFYKPVAAAMRYPCMVHNQVLPMSILNKSNLPESPVDFKRYGGLTTQVLSQLYPPNASQIATREGAALQEYDDWYPEYEPAMTSQLFRTLVQVDLDDPTLILDLKDLPGYTLDADAVAYLRENPSSVTVAGENVFRVTLYDRYIPVRDIVIDMDSDLIVRGLQPLSVRRNYHLVVSINYDVQSLYAKAKDRLRRHGNFFIKLMDYLAPEMRRRGELPSLTETGSVPLADYNRLLHRLTLKRPVGAPIPAGNTNARRVGQFIVVSHRSE